MSRCAATGLIGIGLSALLLFNRAAAAAEPIAIIVPLSEAKRALSVTDLALIYRRKKLFWPDGLRIVPINLPASSPVRRAFSTAVFDEEVEASQVYWNDMYFHGITPPFVASSDEAVIRYVEQSKEGIGYVPLCSVDKRVAIVLVIDSNGQIGAPGNAAASCAK